MSTQQHNTRTNRPISTNTTTTYNKIHNMDISPQRDQRRGGSSCNCKWVLAIIFLILVALVIVCLYYLVRYENQCIADTNNKKKCQQMDCILLASTLISPIKTNINPCNNFYEYSCGLQEYSALQDINTFIDTIEYQSNVDLKNAIEEQQKQQNNESHKYMANLFKYYNSCLNTDAIIAQEVNPLRSIINSLNGWPVLEGNDWGLKHYHWINTYVMIRKMGLNADTLIKFSIEKDIRQVNSSQYIIAIDAPDFDVTADRLKTMSKDYINVMVTFATMMGANKDYANNDLLEVLVFEEELILLSNWPSYKQNYQNLTNDYITVKELYNRAPNINWLQLLTEFFGSHVNDDMEVRLLAPLYITKLSPKLPHTNPRTLANYLIWKVIYHYSSLLSPKWQKPVTNFRLITDDYLRPSRWQTCVQQMKTMMPIEMANVYLNKYFNKQHRDEAISMIDKIKESFVKSVDENKWMTTSVKTIAKRKILLMKSRIGFPIELTDHHNYRVNSWLSPNIEITDDYFSNTLKLNQFLWDKHKELLFDLNQNTTIRILQNWMKPTEFAVKYRHEDNVVMISDLMINGFFKQDLPKSIIYGTLGLLISEQMLSMFDDKGRHYDEHGIYGTNWWDSTTTNGFRTYANCYEKQMNDFDVIIARKTMTESHIQFLRNMFMKDKETVSLTFDAYKLAIGAKGVDSGIMGFNETADTLFWLSVANTYYKHSNYQKRLIDDKVLIEFRINLIASTIDQFAKKFKCTVIGYHCYQCYSLVIISRQLIVFYK
ncbi:neprilysin-2-like [Oppia nitens]|uniref:neprilysin-2-like n=1 Tax=Oppia nitens TaxID=1686743 RepID=UPI0023DB8485|nr:neprilysin-2-like [Oppia nitens]